MARKRYSDEDVLNLLRQIELSLASGSSIETVSRHQRCDILSLAQEVWRDGQVTASGAQGA